MSLPILLEIRRKSAGKLLRAQENLRDIKDKAQYKSGLDKVELAQLEYIFLNNSVIEEQERIIKENEEKIKCQ